MATPTSGNARAGLETAIEFVEQLFRDGTDILDVWALNDDGFAPYGEDDESPVFTLTRREIDAARKRARRAP